MKRKLDMLQKDPPKSQSGDVAVSPTTPPAAPSLAQCAEISVPTTRLVSVLPLLLQLSQLVATACMVGGTPAVCDDHLY